MVKETKTPTIDNLIFKESVERLTKLGLGPLVELLMTRDSVAYTHSGRLNCSGIRRTLKINSRQLDEALMILREEFER